MIDTSHPHRPAGARPVVCRHCPALAGLCALALTVGLPNLAGAGVIEVIGETVGPITNTEVIEYILIDQGDDGSGTIVPARVTGAVINDTGGNIAGDGSHSGIGVYNVSVVEGALINHGAIDAGTNYAIEVRDATISGGIQNTGGLDGDAGGILVDALSLDFTCGVVNAGQIDSGGEGVSVQSAAFAGGVTNAGRITSGLTGIFVDVDGGGGSFAGGIDNSGEIESSDNPGIRVLAGALSGGVRNSGDITALNDRGVVIEAGSIAEGLVNEGTIISGAAGIRVQGGSLTGGFRNSGTITSADGDAVAFSLDSLSGGIENRGTLVATARDGLALEVTDFAGDIVNAGGIEVAGNGILIGSGSVVSGAVVNDTDGTMGGAGSVTAAAGIVVAGGAEVRDGLSNHGSITAGAAISVAADGISGAVENTGRLTGDLFLAGSDPGGGGIDLTNSGQIDLGVPMFASTLVSGDLRQTGTGSLALTLQSFSEYVGIAPVLVLGDLALAGELLLDLDPGFGFVPWQRLTLIGVGGARSGLFDNYADDGLVRGFGGRNGLYLDYTDDGDIALYTTPLPPTGLLIGWGMLCGALFGRRRRGCQSGRRCDQQRGNL